MRSAHLTLALFCHFLLASVVFYFAPVTTASPVAFTANGQPPAKSHVASNSQQVAATAAHTVQNAPAELAAPSQPAKLSETPAVAVAASKQLEPKSAATQATKSGAGNAPAPAAGSPAAPQEVAVVVPGASARAETVPKKEQYQPGYSARSAASAPESVLTKKDSDTVQPSSTSQQKAAPTSPLDGQQQQQVVAPVSSKQRVDDVQTGAKQQQPSKEEPAVAAVPQPAALVAERGPDSAPPPSRQAPASVVSGQSSGQQQQQQVVAKMDVNSAASGHSEKAPQQAQSEIETRSAARGTGDSPSSRTQSPVVMGGLGPLHLLATTLCSYQSDKPVADETLNQLYARRATVRKSLFDFMSLKFTNLEKLSSRLGVGLQVVPSAVVAKADPGESNKPGTTPSHGWPVVGKCTAHDLKLMGEAAWCECNPGDNCASSPSNKAVAQQVAESPASPADQQQAQQQLQQAQRPSASADEDKPAPMASNQHRVMSGRSIDSDATYSLLPSPEESSVISKILHVSSIKSAPLVESSIYNLNLTQHQLAALEAHTTSTQECRRNALRYTKALFNHLAEDQRHESESWPKLYAALSADDCARKRLIDVVTALSGFRTDTTSIRRDNLEFAFAMDDLRAKVLENEVNTPLTFDRHFIEVEQFLQQSVRLMLANIQPKRAKLTSMRYRSLMYGASGSSDEQCIDLHQRLLAKNYPNDCNPTQFGQLPDVLRMTANSLELWSIEKELSLRMADYPNESPAGQQKVSDDVNECIANLVSS